MKEQKTLMVFNKILLDTVPVTTKLFNQTEINRIERILKTQERHETKLYTFFYRAEKPFEQITEESMSDNFRSCLKYECD